VKNKRLADAIANLQASDSTQIVLIIDATIGLEPVTLSAENIGSSWKLAFEWQTKGKTLDEVFKGVFKDALSLESLPDEIKEYKPGSIRVEYATFKTPCKGLSLGIGDLNMLRVSSGEGSCWGFVHEKPIEIPTSGMVATLLGKQLKLIGLHVGNVSHEFNEPLRQEVVAQLPQARLLLLGEGGAPAKGFVAGVTIEGIGASLIELPFRGITVRKGVDAAKPQAQAAAGTAGSKTPTSVDTSDGMRKWFPVNKSIGPLRLGRVGCEWKNGKIGLLLDAAIDSGALRLGLSGLAIRLPPSDPKPANLEVGLDGIDIAYRGGPVTISGGLFKHEVMVEGMKTDLYDGTVLIKAADFTLTGLGSYAAVGGEPSLFIFAILHKELGGPPIFRVNGLAAGLGYNRKLKLPSIEEVESFPLVRAALDEGYFASDGAGDAIQTAMRKLRDYTPPANGECWFSIGIRFNSFEMIRSFALLSVSFGSDLTISILGLSRLTIPSKLPKDTPPLSYAELALRAEFNPSVGVLSVEARLTSNSYIFEKACKLTGGFAFFTWFQGEHEGDFVVTLGGYHARFVPPLHYPVVPRVGFDWIVSRHVRITGELYFALTPSCLMAGGRLSAVYDAGWLKAWFIAYADFLIAWKPFRYDTAIGVSIGASATVRVNFGFFTISMSFTFELGAALHVWGPPFAGKARIKFYIVSFTVRFGDQGRQAPTPVDWDEFSKSFLPKPKSVCSVAFTGGLLQEWKRDDGQSVAIVNGHELAFSVQSQAPCTAVQWKQNEIVPGSGEWAGKLGVPPMFASDLDSTLTLELKASDGKTLDSELFSTSVLRKGFPEAMWGQGKPDLGKPTSKVLHNVPAGVAGVLSERGKQGQIRHSLPAMALEKFKFEKIDKGIPWSATSFPEGIIAQGDKNLPNTVWGNKDVSETRAAVLEALAGVTPYPLNEVSLAQTAARAATIFQAEPTYANLGQLLPEEK
jgi:hypothetical protein